MHFQKNFYIILICFIAGILSGQEIKFLNSSNNTNLTNPSLAGFDKDKLHLQSTYKESLLTLTQHHLFNVAINSKLLSGIRSQDWIGGGFNYTSDSKGVAKYNSSDWNINLAYHFNLTKDQNRSLSFGFSLNSTKRKENSSSPYDRFIPTGFGSPGPLTIGEPYEIIPGNGQSNLDSLILQTPMLINTFSPKTKPALSSLLNFGFGISYSQNLDNSSLSFGISYRRSSISRADFISGGYATKTYEYYSECTPTLELTICNRTNDELAILFGQAIIFANYKIQLNQNVHIRIIPIVQHSRYFTDSQIQSIVAYKPNSQKDLIFEIGTGFKNLEYTYKQIIFGFELKKFSFSLLYEHSLNEPSSYTYQSLELSLGYTFSL